MRCCIRIFPYNIIQWIKKITAPFTKPWFFQMATQTDSGGCSPIHGLWHVFRSAGIVPSKSQAMASWNILLVKLWYFRQNDAVCTGFVFPTEGWSVCREAAVRGRTTWKLHEAGVRGTDTDDRSGVPAVSVKRCKPFFYSQGRWGTFMVPWGTWGWGWDGVVGTRKFTSIPINSIESLNRLELSALMSFAEYFMWN